ncbi:MAG: 1,4-alpha-glucan branching enzyme, partial [Epulopiscium sp. Nele67-Bin001]
GREYALDNMGNGLFEGIVGKCKKRFPYTLVFTSNEGVTWQADDPYAFTDALTDEELKRCVHEEYIFTDRILGSKITTIDEVEGCIFRVWAPNAKRVSVIGEFNNWDGRRHMMNKQSDTGIFSLFIPGITEESGYQYEIRTPNNELLYKADPYAKHFGTRPNKYSLPYDPHKYVWGDHAHLQSLEHRNNRNLPICIYEVHLGSWKHKPGPWKEEGYVEAEDEHNDGKFLTYRDFAEELVEYVKKLNYTHVELMGVLEHPFDGSWGYQVTGFFAPTSRYGTPDDFKYLVDRFHQNGIGVIVDWVPGHFPKDAFALEVFDGHRLFEHEGEHPEWGTLKFNYYKREVKNFLLSSAIMWLEEFHVDGLRVDAVASMLYGGDLNSHHADMTAVQFLKELNGIINARYPHKLIIAEDSSTWDGVTRDTQYGGLGFDFKWSLGWMHDVLGFMHTEYDYRRYALSQLTFSFNYMYNEHYILPLSHDEVVHCKSPLLYKMCGDWWQKFSNLRTCYGLMYTHPGKKLLFMGGEIGQTSEWSEKTELDWHLLQYDKHQNLQNYVRDLNEFYRNNEALYMEDNIGTNFEWINGDNQDTLVISFIRRTLEQELVVVLNFSLNAYEQYEIGVSRMGNYVEVFNSDDEKYSGSGVVNTQVISAVDKSVQYKPHSIIMRVPPLGMSILEWQR